MALWKKGKSADAAAGGAGTAQTVQTETVTDPATGEEKIVRTVREWHPHAPETLPEIEAAIDAWGGGYRSTEALPARPAVDLSNLAAKVDRVTRRVKGSRKVVIQETVTEWVEGPVGSGPVAVTEEVLEPPARGHGNVHGSRPKRRFLSFGRKESPGGSGSAQDYQPQCAALTDDGAQGRNSSRHGSRYCSSHKGYQPPTAKGLAQRIEGDAWDPSDNLTDRQSVASADTRPRVRKAKDTKVKVRRSPKRKR